MSPARCRGYGDGQLLLAAGIAMGGPETIKTDV